jgi:hypothetical protein
MNKDLKILAKEKRDELLAQRVYIDTQGEGLGISLIVDRNPLSWNQNLQGTLDLTPQM